MTQLDLPIVSPSGDAVAPQNAASARSAERPRRPLLSIRPATGWSGLNLREIWAFRDLIVTLAVRDVKLRYRQTYLGAIWVILQPLLAAGVFSFVFGTVAKLPSDGVPYILFSYAGLVGWNAFTGMLLKTSHSMVGNAHLITKVYFPRLVIPLSGILSTLLDTVVGLIPLAVMLAWYGVRPGLPVLTLPIWLAGFVLLGMGLGLIAGAMLVAHRDIGHLLPVATQALMYASPVAYAVSAVPVSIAFAYRMNPLASLLQGIRWALLGQAGPQWGAAVISLLIVAGCFVCGTFVFQRMERRFVDII